MNRRASRPHVGPIGGSGMPKCEGPRFDNRANPPICALFGHFDARRQGAQIRSLCRCSGLARCTGSTWRRPSNPAAARSGHPGRCPRCPGCGRQAAGTATYSAKAPLTVLPTAFQFAHRLPRPPRHARQWPQNSEACPPDIRGGDVLPRHRAAPRVEGVAELGGDHHLVTMAGQRAAQQPLAVPGAVDVRGIEERDPQLIRAAQRRGRFRLIDLAPADRDAAAGAIGPFCPAWPGRTRRRQQANTRRCQARIRCCVMAGSCGGGLSLAVVRLQDFAGYRA